MAKFEQELIRVVERGCPECGSPNLLKVSEYQEPSNLLRVVCGDSEDPTHILWTAEDGWIPELQDVVKGE